MLQRVLGRHDAHVHRQQLVTVQRALGSDRRETVLQQLPENDIICIAHWRFQKTATS